MFKQHKNKKFNYKHRFSKEKEANDNFEENSKDNEFVSKWKRASKRSRNRDRKGISMRLLIIILVLLLISMYILDFKFI